MSSSFHPQTDVQTERANRTLEEMIRHYVAHKQDDWSRLLPALEISYNTSKHRATGKIPNNVCTGRDPVKFDELLLSSASKSPAATEHVVDLQSRAAAAADSVAVYNRAMKAQANKSRREDDYQVGDRALLSTRFFKPPADVSRGRKLAPKYAGPYEIIYKVSPVAYKLQLPPGTNTHPVFHSSLLRTSCRSVPINCAQLDPQTYQTRTCPTCLVAPKCPTWDAPPPRPHPCWVRLTASVLSVQMFGSTQSVVQTSPSP
jgi:hypothetical protein